MKIAVVLYNLGGPETLEDVKPFLLSLFNDRAVIDLPQPFRSLVAHLIAGRRNAAATEIYRKIGGGSPIHRETKAQAVALKELLSKETTDDIEIFPAMNHPSAQIRAVARQVVAFQPDKIVLCPLYPQYSTTTTGSFLRAWKDESRRIGLRTPVSAICCYPTEAQFVDAHATLIRTAIQGRDLRVLFSAHGLPQRVVRAGDPYQWQIEQTSAAIVSSLKNPILDWRICYQSRVGPLAWLEPATEGEIRMAGAEGKGVVVVPIAFVSEHSETLVELDMDYADIARACGAQPYIRVPALSLQPRFIDALAALTRKAIANEGIYSDRGGRICPAAFARCPHGGRAL